MRCLLAAVLLMSAVAARAVEGKRHSVKTGLRAIVGSAGFVGRGTYLQYGYGDAWRVKGSYSDYRFDGSTGTTRSAALRGSYQGDSLGAGAMVSVTPRNDAYANRAFGGDLSWTFILDDSDEPSGLTDLEVGGWWTQTRHSQVVPGNAAKPVREIVINQHDLGLSAALSGWDFTFSVDGFKTLYDQNFDALPRIAISLPRLGETASLVNSFPERGGSISLEYYGWDLATPYVSLSTTKYKIQPQPATTTAGTGVSFKRGPFAVDLGVEGTRQKGAPDTRYFTFSGSVRF